MPNLNSNKEIRISIRIPHILYEKLEKIKEKKGYKTMSELIRDILRDYAFSEVVG